MAKFKKGDKVRIIDDSFEARQTTGIAPGWERNGSFAGREGVVHLVQDSGRINVHSLSDAYYGIYEPWALELVDKPSFKVGDRVRVKNENAYVGLTGRVGTVIENNPAHRGQYQVKLSGKRPDALPEGLGFRADELELVEEQGTPQVFTTNVESQMLYFDEVAYHDPDIFRQEYLAAQEAGCIGDWAHTPTGSNPFSKKLKGGFMESLRTIPKKIKKLLNKGLQAEYQLGWIDEELELTSRGIDEYVKYLHDKDDGGFGKAAQARVKEIEEEEKDD